LPNHFAIILIIAFFNSAGFQLSKIIRLALVLVAKIFVKIILITLFDTTTIPLYIDIARVCALL